MQVILLWKSIRQVWEYQGGSVLGDEEGPVIFLWRTKGKWNVIQGILEILIIFMKLLWNRTFFDY